MGDGFFQLLEHLLHLPALHVCGAADRTTAADHRETVLPGKGDDLLLLHVDQRPDDGHFSVVRQHRGRHRLQ